MPFFNLKKIGYCVNLLDTTLTYLFNLKPILIPQGLFHQLIILIHGF